MKVRVSQPSVIGHRVSYTMHSSIERHDSVAKLSTVLARDNVAC